MMSFFPGLKSNFFILHIVANELAGFVIHFGAIDLDAALAQA